MHTTILTRADIERINPASLASLLSQQAGLAIDSSSRSGSFASLYLRGADPSHVVFLVDGVRQNDPLSSRGSAVDFNTLPLADIERIEIVRGSASLRDREALAGLVQIFTRRSAAAGARVQIGVGGDGFQTFAGQWRGDSGALSATSRNDGLATHDGRSKNRSINGGFHSQIGQSTALAATLRATDADSLSFPDDSGGRRFAARTTKEHRQTETVQSTLQTTTRFKSLGTVTTSLAFFSRQSDESTPGVARGLRDPAGLPPIDTRGDYQRREMQLWWRPEFTHASWRAIVGVDGQVESVVYDSRIKFGSFIVPALFKQRRDTLGLIAEARYQGSGWGLQTGLRHDLASGRAGETNPGLSAEASCGNTCGVFGASWSSAAKPPSFYALAHPLVGNVQLKPESTRQFEIFYATNPSAAWYGRVTLFSARYRDLIDFDAGPPPRLVNRARIDSGGIEVTAQRQLTERMSLNLNAMAMDIRDPKGGVPLRQRPKQQASARLSGRFADGWDGQLQLKHVSRRYDSSIPTGDVWLPSYRTVDATLNFQMAHLRISLALDNLLDKRFDETIGTAASSRRARLGIHWQI